MRKHVKGFLSLVLSVMLVSTSFISVNAYSDSVTINRTNISLNYLDEEKPGDYIAVTGTLKNSDAVVSNQEIAIDYDTFKSITGLSSKYEAEVKGLLEKYNTKQDEANKKLQLVNSLEKNTEEYNTALTAYNTAKAEAEAAEKQYLDKDAEYGAEEKKLIPDFNENNWNKLSLTASTDTENRYAAEPSGKYPYYVTWVKVTVNGTDYYNYSVNCIVEEVINVCRVVDGKYYDKNGKEVTEAEYNKSCNPVCKVSNGKYYDNNGKEVSKDAYTKACGNPKTGINMYYTYGAVIVIAACGLYMATRKVKKLSK